MMLIHKMKILIQEISFREILPIWEHCLWPSRKSRIEPTSIIDHMGELSLEMERLNPVFFWGGFRGKNNQLVAVLSAFPTSEDHFRCRGLWVHPEVRGTGVGRELILKAEQESLKLGRTILWTMPRMAALEFYLKCGFTAGKLLSQYEFGPHVLAEKNLARS